METIVKMLESPAAQALGWALIHSLWQGLLCFLLGLAMLRFIPIRHSALRYATSVGVMGVMLLCSLVTLGIVYTPALPGAVGADSFFKLAGYTQSGVQASSPLRAMLTATSSWLGAHMGVFSALWLMGAMLFVLRIVSGYWYMRIVRRSADSVGAYWQQRVDDLAAKLNIRSFVEVAESSLITAPLVMGYLKPVILVPVGMFSGLTTDQLEAVFVHELLHIRRGDYLVNLAQTILEAVYFFNPFAWMMSAAIRREREHCCDDGVLSNHGNAMAYVQALAMLEEVKLSRTGVALSLAEDKNQLLKRIKRIMEKSVNHYSSSDRLVPAVLLIIGLMCASWLTIQSRDRKAMEGYQRNNNQPAQGAVVSDTTDKQKTGTYYHYSVTTIDDNGKEDVRVVEGYGDDAQVRDALQGVEPIAPIEPVEPVEPFESFVMDGDPFVIIDAFPAVAPMVPPGVFVMPHPPVVPHGLMPMFLSAPTFDTIPQMHGSWEEFGREFEETFQKRFGEFYQQNEEGMKEMMKEVEGRLSETQALRTSTDVLARNAEVLSRLDEARARDREWATRAEEFSRRAEEAQRNLARMEDKRRAMELAQVRQKIDAAQRVNMDQLSKEMEVLNSTMRDLEKRMHKAQESVQKEAVKDGYLKKDEKIDSININDDSMEINGKKIKPADAKRYRAIMEAADPHWKRRDE
jgi:bla regulator protein BlaR1